MDRVEIWDPARWRDYSTERQEKFAELDEDAGSPHDSHHRTTAAPSTTPQGSAGRGLGPLPHHLGHLPRFQTALPLPDHGGRGSGLGPGPADRLTPEHPSSHQHRGSRTDEHRASAHVAYTRQPPPTGVRPRVRHQAREAATLMVFSAATSVGGRGRASCSSRSLGGRLTMTAPPTSRSCSTGSSPCWRPRSTGTGAVLVDATLGLGGHSEAVLTAARAGPGDRHRPRPRTRSSWPAQRLAPFGDRFTGVHAVYDELPDVLDDLGLRRGRRRALRPRRLLDAARRPRARLRLRRGRAARHADGRHRPGRPRPTSSTPTTPPS